MVLSAEEKRERKREYYHKNKEKVKKLKRESYHRNKEKNREKEKARHNKIAKTPAGIKTRRISKWRGRGVVCEDFDSLYCHYLNAEECDNCNITFGEVGDGSNTWKCLDHDHKTGAFRAFLCNGCNMECNN